jgi:glycolate oxidase iron-sulfur subunit
MGIKQQPRTILRSIPEIEYIEMPNADQCCGMAGSFSLNYYNLSKQIADRKITGIISTGADIVVTGCPGCEIQLIDQAINKELSLKVMHIMDILE